MVKFKFLITWLITIGGSVVIILSLILSTTFISAKSNNVILGTSWNRSGVQYKSLETIVKDFNKEHPSTHPIVLKQIEVTKIDSIVGTGTLGIKKLPNLFITYGDTFLNQDRLLQTNTPNVLATDLKDIVFQDENNKVISEFMRETTHRNKLIVAPIGKSIDYMFVNKLLVAEVFKALGLNDLSSTVLENQKILEPKIKIKIDQPQEVSGYKTLSQLKTVDDVKKMFNNWKSVSDFFEAANYVLQLNQDKKIFLLGVDDPSSVAYVHYANEKALDNEEKMQEEFIYSEDENNNFKPIINAAKQSKIIFNDFLLTFDRLKKLAPRSSSDPERFNGIRIRMVSNDYNSSFFANGDMISTIGSSAGINNLMRNGLNADDLFALPVPGKTSGQAIMQQGPGIGMFELGEPTKNKRAKEFVKYLTSPIINQIYAAKANYLPIHEQSYNANSIYFEEINQLPNNTKKMIEKITDTLINKTAKYQSVPVSYLGNIFRYSVLDASIKNFILDVDNNGQFVENGVTVNKFWEILKEKAHNQFSGNFVWKTNP